MRITFALPWTDPSGLTHKPDSTADIDDAAARRLIGDGWARPAVPTAAAAKKAAKKAARKPASRTEATPPAQSITESPATTGSSTEKE